MHMRSGNYVLVQEFGIPRAITFQYQMIFVSISEFNPSEMVHGMNEHIQIFWKDV